MRFNRANLASAWRGIRTIAETARIFATQEFLADVPQLIIKQRHLKDRVRKNCECFVDIISDIEKWVSQLSLEEVKSHGEQENSRRTVIEDKAKINLLGITLAFPIIFSGLSLLAGAAFRIDSGKLTFAVFSLLLIGVIYLLVGGLYALSALNIGQVYVSTPRDEAEESETRRKARLVWNLDQNQLTTVNIPPARSRWLE